MMTPRNRTDKLPKYLIAKEWPEDDLWWIIRTRNPFLLARVSPTGQNSLTLHPWPNATFSGLTEAKQTKVIQSAGAAWLMDTKSFARIAATRADVRCVLMPDMRPPSALVGLTPTASYIISPAEPIITIATETRGGAPNRIEPLNSTTSPDLADKPDSQRRIQELLNYSQEFFARRIGVEKQ